jgi:hypothetical protein
MEAINSLVSMFKQTFPPKAKFTGEDLPDLEGKVSRDLSNKLPIPAA